MYFQVWHRLSIPPIVFKSGFVFKLTPTFLPKTKGYGSLGAEPLSGAHPASSGDNVSSELANRLDGLLYINSRIE